MDYSVLKNGTDITHAFVVWYVNKYNKASSELVIDVGHNSRITGEEISKKVIEVFKEFVLSNLEYKIADEF